ncbi:hypothetical protein APUTEX25_000579 [Auxenochlorella protothecoides]|uniref:Protein kinase domain-containing protein n=1 Tax=Auxenochlorella protothecoides TaxID=3075 RepID=A0A3M7KUL4_AUXPR|nr:hypothetical protein APUTEX25_000579 [Auxenochlorella protothecoides]|eukprot:RMZ54228.1 hypothetical protein APUTEX25_000579 [Auxenochlorella protothecoides]
MDPHHPHTQSSFSARQHSNILTPYIRKCVRSGPRVSHAGPGPGAQAAPWDYPTTADAYDLLEEAGRGVSATVWRAYCKVTKDHVAVKLLDLENMNCSLDEIVREAQTMRSLNHPNLLPLLASFVHKDNLWMVMPYVSGGSVQNIMRFAYSDGLEEGVIATIMRDVLRGLDYLHSHGIIHRDVKAGNILLTSSGQVLLADFGVAATLERGGSWGNRVVARSTFVGTPCWMAPEVMEQSHGYDARADVWSFGITLLECAHGHAPFARLPPMKVLLMTIQNPPPTLDSEPTKKTYTKAMRELVGKCLVKDPAKRPTAAALLEHKFFKSAHDADYLVRRLLAGLPSVPERVQLMRQGHGQKPDAQDREIQASQEEYRRGVSSWNFDVAALKAAAAEARSAEERLPPISETSEVGELARQMSAAQVSEALDRGKAPIESHVSGSSSGLGSPPHPAAGTSGARTPDRSRRTLSKGASLMKEQGRFKVYEGDEAPPFATPPDGGRQNGAQYLDDFARARGTPGDAAASTEAQELEKAKRKGRFRYVEEDFEARARTPGLAHKSASVAASLGEMRSMSSVSPTGPPVGILTPHLQHLLESLTLQQETLREMVAGVSDAERGRMGALNSFISERQTMARAPREYVERLRQEVLELREENARLRERLRQGSSEGPSRNTTSESQG